MKKCPVCSTKVKEDGRCRNVSCSAYSHRVCEEDPSCDKCGQYGAAKNRQNTAYEDDEKNYATLCDICQTEEDEHWKYMWADYWSSRL